VHETFILISNGNVLITVFRMGYVFYHLLNDYFYFARQAIKQNVPSVLHKTKCLGAAA
jgi:hypothetical protein